MTDLTQDQEKLRTRINRNAIIWGAVAGLIVFLLLFWLAAGLGEAVRWGAAVIGGGAAGFFGYRGLYSSGAGKAKCAKCGTAFSVREVDRKERLLGYEPKRTVEPSGDGKRTIKTWTEERYEVTATDECSHCHDRTERKWTTTREKDGSEVEEIVPPAAQTPAGTAAGPTRGLGGSAAPSMEPTQPAPEPPTARPASDGSTGRTLGSGPPRR
jgi:hypothetical protein